MRSAAARSSASLPPPSRSSFSTLNQSPEFLEVLVAILVVFVIPFWFWF
jgi:hypothetical protein